MSTDKPSIGLVILDVLFEFLDIFQISPFNSKAVGNMSVNVMEGNKRLNFIFLIFPTFYTPI